MVGEGEKSDDLSGEKLGDAPAEKTEYQEMGIDFLGEKSSPDKLKTIGGIDETSASQPQRDLNFGSQELTLSYMCENSKLGFPEKEVLGQTLLNSLDKLSGKNKGKEIADPNEEEGNNNVWVERDFMQLTESNVGNSSKREFSDNLETIGGENEEKKKPKVESLNLSLSLPDVSLSLAGSNRVPICDLPSRLRPSRSLQSLGASFNNNTQTTYSNDFTAASLSYSYSHQFSHNASCSLTRNSTENHDCDQIWNGGEGTNGSVHSRFRPVGDGTVALSNRNGFNNNSNSLHRTASSDNISFFPSELPARPRMDSEDLDVVKARGFSTPERILREIVSESVPVMAQIIQELTKETVDSVKAHLNNIVDNKTLETRDDELAGLQRRLERRSDLTRETLSKCQRNQLEIMVAIKMGIGSFLNNQVPSEELSGIFLLERCRNINCRRMLPVDDCDCKICSTKKGFCSECMCPVCLNFDCASNTCSWVGCDACSHWCHVACGLKRNLIRPSPCLKSGPGSVGGTEMQFHCMGCGHASEMFGFVKEVFMSCAKEWSLENLMKELYCVGNVFVGSEDRKGKELGAKAMEMLAMARTKMMSRLEVCESIFRFFNSTHNYKEASNGPTPFDPYRSEKIIGDEWSVSRKGGFDSLESLVRIKEAEARMFQGRADDVRAEIERYRRMMRVKREEVEEYGGLQEAEERRRRKAEELKVLESSHCDYYKMKIRMQSEISGLLKRMESTKQQKV